MSDVNKYIGKIKKKYRLEHIKKLLNKFKNMKVLVIGDAILDQYVFVWPKGRAIKDPILSTEYKHHETYPGGILAIANHVSNFVKQVKLVTLIGERRPRVSLIKRSMRKNIDLKLFTKEDAFTVVKKRYVDYYRNNKLFKIEYMNDRPITSKLSKDILRYLDKELPKYDLVIVGDFGHGFINQEIRDKLGEESQFLALNAQSNSANMGYNYFSLYTKPDFMSLSEDELRLPLYRRFEDIDEVVKECNSKYELNKFLVTLGKRGCVYVNNGKLFKAPVLITTVKDTVGAGDALFAVSSLLAYAEADDELVPFIANCAGGLAVNIMGNKDSIDKEALLKFIKELYDGKVYGKA